MSFTTLDVVSEKYERALALYGDANLAACAVIASEPAVEQLCRTWAPRRTARPRGERARVRRIRS